MVSWGTMTPQMPANPQHNKMAIYKITHIDHKVTKTNKPYAMVMVSDLAGEYRASMWEGYEALKVGDPVDGELTVKGDFTNFRLSGQPRTFAPRAASRGADIKAAQEMKATHIKSAQDNREKGIQLAGAMRDATTVTLASLRDQPFPTDEEFKEEWRKWREFFIKEFDTKSDNLKNIPF